MKRLLLFLPLLLTACLPATAPQTLPATPSLSPSPSLLIPSSPTPLFTPSPTLFPTLPLDESTLYPTLTPLPQDFPDPRLTSLFDLILHPTWNTLWLDAQSLETGTNGITYYVFVQAWLDQSAGGRVIHSSYLEKPPWSLPDFKPRFIWLSDGGSPNLFDYGIKTPESGNMRWFVHPLDTAGELINSLVFAYSFLQKPPRAIVGQETFAGRPAFILDWSEDTGTTRLFWVDSVTGLILRRLIVNTETQEILQDFRLNTVIYGVDVSPDIYAPENLDAIGFEEPPTSTGQTLSNTPTPSASTFTLPPVAFPTSTPFAGETEIGMIVILAAQESFSPLTDQLMPAFYRLAPGGIVNPILIPPETDLPTTFALSPDRQWIVFGMGTWQDQTDLYKMRVDGTDLQRLTNTPENEDHPQWSPDGTEIVYDRYLDGTTTLWKMSTDGQDALQLGEGAFPVWAQTPDGQTWLFFTADYDGNSEIYRMNSDGTQRTNLSQTPSLIENFLILSPDGIHAAFTSIHLEDHRGQITLLNLVTGEKHLLGPFSGRDEPKAWSPDGRYLLLQASPAGSMGNQMSLYLWDSQTGAITDLTQNLTYQTAFFLAWSPDGRQILVQAEYGGPYTTNLIDIETLQAIPITAIGNQLIWSNVYWGLLPVR